MSNLSVAQILLDAQRMAGRVKDLDTLGGALLVKAEINNRLVESLQKFQDDVDSLNRIANNKSNADIVNRIQQQNANSSEILKENRELKVCIEDYERAMELIMQKYREHASNSVIDNKATFKEAYNEKLWKVIREQREKINEMAAVMYAAATVDDCAINREIEMISKLRLENETLRELLQISRQFDNSYRSIRSNELNMAEKAVQTEDDSSDELSLSGASAGNPNNNTVIHISDSNMSSAVSTATADVVAVTDSSPGNNNNNNSTVNAVELSTTTPALKLPIDSAATEDVAKAANVADSMGTATINASNGSSTQDIAIT